MHFQERELQSYAVPVLSIELQEGIVYFSLHYAYENMSIPFMGTLRFVGRNLDAGDTGLLYFDEVRAGEDIRYDKDTIEYDDEYYVTEENQLKTMFQFERALDGLMWCSLRRRNLDAQGPMRFEARELTPNPEPVTPSDLQDRSVYFAISYADDDKLIPVMNTLVFIGRNLETRDNGKLYFQDFDSYDEGVSYDSADKPNWASFHIQTEKDSSCIFEFERALEELMRCSLRRRNV